MGAVDSFFVYLAIGVALLVVLGVGVGLVLARRGEPRNTRPRPGIDYAPGVGDDDTTPRDTPRRLVETAVGGIDTLPGPDLIDESMATDVVDLAEWEVEVPEPAAGRFARLRQRLARSESTLGRGLLALLTRDNVDEATWEEIEEVLLTADLGVASTTEMVHRLRGRERQPRQRGRPTFAVAPLPRHGKCQPHPAVPCNPVR